MWTVVWNGCGPLCGCFVDWCVNALWNDLWHDCGTIVTRCGPIVDWLWTDCGIQKYGFPVANYAVNRLWTDCGPSVDHKSAEILQQQKSLKTLKYILGSVDRLWTSCGLIVA